MSHEELIHATYEAWREDDLDAWLETCDPEIEFRTSGTFPDLEPIYRGHEGMRDFWAAIRAPWEWFHLYVERIVEGNDRAAVAIYFRARGQESGVKTELHQGHAMHFRNRRVFKLSTHTSFEQALEVAGLQEEAALPDSS